jgi:hypothetical protein
MIMAVAIAASGSRAMDLVPTSLTVTMVDSVSDPDGDSISVTLVLSTKNGATKIQNKVWTAVQISVEGELKMTGIVDSGQSLASNQSYTWKMGAWVDKKPFSIAAYVDPESLLPESAAESSNNILVKKYAFRATPSVIDTVYAGPNCPKGK